MAKTKKQTKAVQSLNQYDGVFALKLALYVVLGSMWLKVSWDNSSVSLPVGLAVGMILTSHERFRIDRKIDYAVLLVAALIGFWAPFGLYISL